MKRLLIAITTLAVLSGGALAFDDPDQESTPADFCRHAIRPDRQGWTDGSYAASADRRGFTFRRCDEMNNSIGIAPSPATPSPKTEIDHIASGVASTLFYDQNCEKLPKAFIYATNVVAGTISPLAIAQATDRAQEAFAVLPKLYCQIHKPIVEKAMADTYDTWHR